MAHVKKLCMKKNANQRNDVPFNELPLLPPDHNKVETVVILRQVVQSSIAWQN